MYPQYWRHNRNPVNLTSLNKTQTFSPTWQTTSVLLVETCVGLNAGLILRRSSNTLYWADILHLVIIISYSKLFCCYTFSCRCSINLFHIRTWNADLPMFVLLSVVSMDSHHCVCCFLLFQRTLTIACAYFQSLLTLLSVICCFSGLSPLLPVAIAFCCFCGLSPLLVLLFCCFHGLLPLFVLLPLFLRHVAIRQPLFILLSLFLRPVAIHKPLFVLLSSFSWPVAIIHILLSVVFYGLSPLLVLLSIA
jgi:hypothetical protein